MFKVYFGDGKAMEISAAAYGIDGGILTLTTESGDYVASFQNWIGVIKIG